MRVSPKVMPFQGKRTASLELPRAVRVDPELQKKIRELAEAGDRPVSHQIARLIRLGIEAEEKKTA